MLSPSVAQLHQQFIDILPQIESVAEFSFRNRPFRDREELIADVVASAWASFVRLIKRGKDPNQFPTALAKYAVMAVRGGKLIGRRCNRRDIRSPLCPKEMKIRVFSLDDTFGDSDSQWKEILVEAKRSTPAETAAMRIDFSQWMSRLKRRSRRIAEALAEGNRPRDLARKYKISDARICQIRREFRQSWMEFQGEAEAESGRTRRSFA